MLYSPYKCPECLSEMNTTATGRARCYSCGFRCSTDYANENQVNLSGFVDFLLDALELASPVDRGRWVEMFNEDVVAVVPAVDVVPESVWPTKGDNPPLCAECTEAPGLSFIVGYLSGRLQGVDGLDADEWVAKAEKKAAALELRTQTQRRAR